MALITAITLGVEIGGGMVSGSWALSSDAVHVFIDLVAIGIALRVDYMVRTMDASDVKKLRGWGGVVSSMLLFIAVPVIVVEAFRRFGSHEPLLSREMTVYAVIGLAGNALSLWILHKSEETHITHVSLVAHVVQDLVLSVGVVLGGFSIMLTGWRVIDPIISLGIAVALFLMSVKIFKRSWSSIR